MMSTSRHQVGRSARRAVAAAVAFVLFALSAPRTAQGQVAAPDSLAPPEPGSLAQPVARGTATAEQDSALRRRVDAWGQPRNTGLAVLEAYLGNLIPWTFNEFSNGTITQISPRSWLRNVEEGWQWDDNTFLTNHFAHPFQGNLYYTAARSNGFGYWSSLMFAAAGSFHWECCGETHYMALNDWANTSLGGAAVGEALYRASSLVLDNQATGRERLLREAAGFVISPQRGLTRMVSGNARRVYANPADAADHVPERLESVVSAGVRTADSKRSARGGELADELEPHGFIDFELAGGSVQHMRPGHPYDWFSLATQVNFIRGRYLGELRIHGNLWQRELGRRETGYSGLVLMQDFEYENNIAFEQGGPAFSLLYVRELDRPSGTRHLVQAGPLWTVLGGVKSELAFLADVDGIRERFREYDFGIGPGARIGYEMHSRRERIVETSYSARYLWTLNGSSLEGSGSSHLLQTFRFRGILPIAVRGFGAGFDYEWFHRRSDFELDDIGVVRQSANQWQVFVTWNPRRGR